MHVHISVYVHVCVGVCVCRYKRLSYDNIYEYYYNIKFMVTGQPYKYMKSLIACKA